MKEADQLAHISDLAQRYGLVWHHCRDSRHCTGNAGLPDVILAGPGGILFVELKSSNHSMTSGQTTWRWTLKAAGVNVVTWLPSHFRDNTVDNAIAALARTRA